METYSMNNSATKAIEDQGTIEIVNPMDNIYDSAAPGIPNLIDSDLLPTKTFTFDAVFSESSSQEQIYKVCAAPIVQSVLEGYNGTIFVYGQTGAGKTHTMEGSFIPNAIQHIFDHVSCCSDDENYLVRVSYFEIYNEDIRDLLDLNNNEKKRYTPLELRESSDGSVYVKDLKTFVVKGCGFYSAKECVKIKQK